MSRCVCYQYSTSPIICVTSASCNIPRKWPQLLTLVRITRVWPRLFKVRKHCVRREEHALTQVTRYSKLTIGLSVFALLFLHSKKNYAKTLSLTLCKQLFASEVDSTASFFFSLSKTTFFLTRKLDRGGRLIQISYFDLGKLLANIAPWHLF